MGGFSGGTINSSILPASDGVQLGNSTQRWTAYVINMQAYGTCVFNGAVSLTSTLSVGSDTTIGGNSSVSGNATITGNATVGGTLGVTGQTSLSAGAKYLGASSGSINLIATAVAGNNTLTLPATTDTVICKASTDILSNKTLTGANSGNSVNLLNSQGPASAITGTGADAVAYTYTMPANTMGPGKGIRIIVGWKHSTGAASVTYKITIGSASIMSVADSGTGSSTAQGIFVNNSGQTTSQYYMVGPVVDGTTIVSPGLGFNTATEDMTVSKIIKFTFSVANTDQVTPQFFMVELIQ